MGIELSSAFVYTLRSADRKAGKAAPAKVTKAAPQKPTKTSGNAEHELEVLIRRIGTDRASEVFQAALARVLK